MFQATHLVRGALIAAILASPAAARDAMERGGALPIAGPLAILAANAATVEPRAEAGARLSGRNLGPRLAAAPAGEIAPVLLRGRNARND